MAGFEVSTEDCNMAYGVTFPDNNGGGPYVFGIVVDGMESATVQGNNLTMTEWTSQACYEAGRNWYVVNVPHASNGSLYGCQRQGLIRTNGPPLTAGCPRCPQAATSLLSPRCRSAARRVAAYMRRSSN
jgi:hypothetical protein